MNIDPSPKPKRRREKNSPMDPTPSKRARPQTAPSSRNKDEWQATKNAEWDHLIIVKTLGLKQKGKEEWVWGDTGQDVPAEEQLSRDMLDVVFLARINEQDRPLRGKPDFKFLMGCWGEATKQLIVGDLDTSGKLDMFVLKEYKEETRQRLSASVMNAAAALLSPDALEEMDNTDETMKIFNEYLCAAPKMRTFPDGFLEALFPALSEWEDGEELPVFTAFLKRIVTTLDRKPAQPANLMLAMLNRMMPPAPPKPFASIRPLFYGLERLSRHQSFVEMLFKHEAWCPGSNIAKTGREFEEKSIFLNIASSNVLNLNDPEFKEIFATKDGAGVDPSDQIARMQRIRKASSPTNEAHDWLTKIGKGFLQSSKKNPEIKEMFAGLLERILVLNQDRQKMRMPEKKVCNGVTMSAIAYVLLQMTNPIFGRKKKKTKKLNIQCEYFVSTKCPKFYWKADRLRQTNVDEVAKKLGANSMKVSFGTRLFALCLFALHIGPVREIDRLDSLERHLQWLQRNQDARSQLQAKRMQALVDALRGAMHNNIRFLAELGRFYDHVVKWMYSLATENPPREDLLGILPEFIIDDIVAVFRFIQLQIPKHRDTQAAKDSFDKNALLRFVMHVIPNDRIIQHTVKRSNLLELLVSYIPRNMQKNDGHVFNNLLDCRKNLVPVCMELYGQQHLFASSIFLARAFRRNVAKILKYCWKHKAHIQRLKELWADETTQKQFIEFMNQLLNDSVSHLDEGLSNLSKVRELTKKIAQTKKEQLNLNEQKEEEKKSDDEQELDQAQVMARHHNSQASDNIEMVLQLATNVRGPFVHPMLCRRLATMIDCYLNKLANKKKRKALAATNFEELKFNPKKLLATILKIFLSLCDSEDFLTKVAEDEGFFNENSYKDTIKLLNHNKLQLTPAEKSLFIKTFDKLLPMHQQAMATEAKLGEIPEKYQDQLMGALMRDPVALPDGSVMDRQYVLQMLMNDKTNPFTRKPMTEKDIKPLPELKKEIQEWVASRLRDIDAEDAQQGVDELNLDEPMPEQKIGL